MIDFAQQCWFLTGPTASGKSDVGAALADLLGAEIVSLDSMAVYCGMDIGTAKPSADERRRVPHHLLDLVEPGEEFSVAEYVRRAAEVVADVRGRDREALFVGGTPLYLTALLRGIDTGPPGDTALRARLENEAATLHPGVLHERLALVDPQAAARLHPHDTRRLVRALEVYQTTGRPISSLQSHFKTPPQVVAPRVLRLDWSRAELYARIDRRVEAMFDAGLVEEVRTLVARHGTLGRTAAQAVGYREVLEYLHEGGDLAEVKARIQARTRRFARRQLTWFRSLAECRRVGVCEPLDATAVARQIAAAAD